MSHGRRGAPPLPAAGHAQRRLRTSARW